MPRQSYGSSNPTSASVGRASPPPTDVLKRFSHSHTLAMPRASTEVGEVTKEALDRTMVRLTTKFRDASVESLAASKSALNFFQRQKLVDQSKFQGHMAEFGGSILDYIRAEDANAKATALASAHAHLDQALSIKPTLTEVDDDYMEMREQSYVAVMSKQSEIFGFKKGSRLDRTYWHTGKNGDDTAAGESKGAYGLCVPVANADRVDQVKTIRAEVVETSVSTAKASAKKLKANADSTQATGRSSAGPGR